MSLVILYIYVEGEPQYVKGAKGGNPSCTMGSEVRNGDECKEACNQLDVEIGNPMIGGTPCYIGGSGKCRQNEENNKIGAGNKGIICKTSGY